MTRLLRNTPPLELFPETVQYNRLSRREVSLIINGVLSKKKYDTPQSTVSHKFALYNISSIIVLMRKLNS